MTTPDQTPPTTESLTRTQILVAMGITAIVLLVAARLWLFFDPVEMLPLVWSVQSVLLGVGLGVGITIASSLVYQVWPAYRQSADFYLELVIKPLIWLDLLWLGLLPGLSEELLFRGVLLPALGLNWTALALSSLCFGVLHFSGTRHWAYIVWATVIGVVLGGSALITNNLLIPIVAHIVTNCISGCFWKLSDQRGSIT